MATSQAVNAQNTKVVTGKVRFSFCNVFEARAFGDNNDPKFSVMLLIPKSDVGTIERCKKAIDAAAQKGLSTKFGGKLPLFSKRHSKMLTKTPTKMVKSSQRSGITPLITISSMCQAKINLSSSMQTSIQSSIR